MTDDLKSIFDLPPPTIREWRLCAKWVEVVEGLVDFKSDQPTQLRRVRRRCRLEAGHAGRCLP